MKPQKILTVIAIALLALLLTGCGPTLKEKIAEVQVSSTITTADVVELLELEGLEVKKQKPTEAFLEKWPDAEVYKVGGENLLLMQPFEGSLNNRYSLVRELEWDIRATYSYESYQEILNAYKPEVGIYAPGNWFGGKNIIALYVNYFSEDALNDKDFEYGSETRDAVKKVFRAGINNMQTEHYTKAGENFAVTAHMNFYQTPYSFEEPYKGTQYDVYLESEIEIQFFDEVLEKYSGKELQYKITGPQIGSKQSGSSGTTTVRQVVKKTEKDDYIIYKPHTGPIQYEVTVTIGDDITETLIVGREGTEAAG